MWFSAGAGFWVELHLGDYVWCYTSYTVYPDAMQDSSRESCSRTCYLTIANALLFGKGGVALSPGG